MKPKHLPRLWCALQGLLPLDGRRQIERDERSEVLSSSERQRVQQTLRRDRQIRAVLSVVLKETKAAT